MSKLKEKLMLSEKGYSDLKKAITACTITNIALLLPSMVACLLFWELLKPFTGETISWVALWKLLGLGVIAAILVFLAAKNDYRKTYIASYKEASTTRLRIAEHLRKLPMSFFNTKDLSDITTNMMADCSSMESMLSSTIPPLIANIISVTLTCICLAFFDWRMALAIFCTMPVTFLIIWCGRKLQLRLFDKQVDVKLEASSQIQEYLEGIKIIKSCGLSGSRFSTLDKALQAMRKIAIKVELASGVLVQGASLILQAGLGITIFIGTVLITGGEIELLPLLVLLMFSTKIYGPILAILSQLTSLFHLGTVTNRMRTLLTTPAMEGEDKDVSKYDIELKSVTFGYNRDDVIKDVSFSIPAGSITALVGPSGSGKSTIAALLMGQYTNYSGELKLSNYEIKNINIYPYITLVSLESYLFSGTLKDNLRMAKEVSEQEMNRVLEKVGILDFVNEQGGLDMRILEGGKNLSGGQRQRLVLARALLKNSPIYIMDEATSNIDVESENKIMEVLYELSKEKLVLCISHRLANLINADQIYCLKDGNIVESGTHEELIQQDGVYCDLFNAQKELERYGV